MTKSGLLGAAAVVLAIALAAPAMAQQVIYDPGRCAQYYPNANCQNLGPNNPYTGDYQRRVAGRQARSDGDSNWNNRRDSGFWPADVAAGAVGRAVGTAGAIATAPFPGHAYARDSYAYDPDGDRGWYGQSYAQRNGFVCQPGTWFRGEDGRPHLCQ
jgi:hypothetical protein